MMHQPAVKLRMIAPCGMNCALCSAHFRDNKKCQGCHGDDAHKPYHCVECSIKNCLFLSRTKSGFCYDCEQFPCRRLKQLDKRYQARYAMSMIDNLKNIRVIGKRQFVKNETKRWQCPACGKLLCVHRDHCWHCNAQWKKGSSK